MGKLITLTRDPVPARSHGHREDLPVRYPKTLDGFPITRLPDGIGTWAQRSAQVIGGLELPPGYDEDGLWNWIGRIDRVWQEIAFDLAQRDQRKRGWDRWLDRPDHVFDPRFGEGLNRSQRVERAITTTWNALARHLGLIVGAGSLLSDAGQQEMLAGLAARHRHLIGQVEERSLDIDPMLRRPGILVGSTLLAIARLTLMVEGATSRLAIAPRADLSSLIDEAARYEAVRIRKLNRWNAQAAQRHGSRS